MKKLVAAVLAVLMLATLCVPTLAADEKLRKIRLSRSEMKMTIGDTNTLTVRYTPTLAVEPVTWISRDEDIATVENGVVTAVGRGRTSIVAKTEGGLQSTCVVEVRKEGQTVPLKKLEMAVDSLTVRVDQTRALSVYFTPIDTTDTDVTWTSSNHDVATVDPEGTVTGIAPGSATITATTDEGGVTATCAVTVPGTVLTAAAKDVEVREPVNSGDSLSSAAARTAVEDAVRLTTKGSSVVVNFKNKPLVSSTVIGAAAFSAESAGRDVLLRFTTTGDDGKTQGILSFDPQAAKSGGQDINTAIYTNTATTRGIQERFSAHFSNSMAVVQLAQAGSYGFAANISVSPSLSSMNTDNLRFYRYDTETNKYKSVELQNLEIDRERIRFTTEEGGVLLIVDGKLSAK